jgi:hypothetical protein
MLLIAIWAMLPFAIVRAEQSPVLSVLNRLMLHLLAKNLLLLSIALAHFNNLLFIRIFSRARKYLNDHFIIFIAWSDFG